MKKIISIFSTLLIVSMFISCSALTGEEIARLAINQVSTNNENLIIKETSLELKKDEEIILWSEMDMEYEGDVALLFKIEILKNGDILGGIEIDPTDKNITLGEVKTSINNKTKWRFSGKNEKIIIEDDGYYTLRGILVASENPTLKIHKAEIVIKK